MQEPSRTEVEVAGAAPSKGKPTHFAAHQMTPSGFILLLLNLKVTPEKRAGVRLDRSFVSLWYLAYFLPTFRINWPFYWRRRGRFAFAQLNGVPLKSPLTTKETAT